MPGHLAVQEASDKILACRDCEGVFVCACMRVRVCVCQCHVTVFVSRSATVNGFGY